MKIHLNAALGDTKSVTVEDDDGNKNRKQSSLYGQRKVGETEMSPTSMGSLFEGSKYYKLCFLKLVRKFS